MAQRIELNYESHARTRDLFVRREGRGAFPLHELGIGPAPPRIVADHLIRASHKPKASPDSDHSLVEVCAASGARVFNHNRLVRSVVGAGHGG